MDIEVIIDITRPQDSFLLLSQCAFCFPYNASRFFR